MWSRQRRKLGQRSRGGRKCRVGGTEGRAVAEAQSEGQGDEEGVDVHVKVLQYHSHKNNRKPSECVF